MSGVNKAIIVGRLGADPELRTTNNGMAVCTLSVATSESWMDKQSGQRQERTEWHRIVVWGKQGENCAKYLSKGRQVFVEGRLQTRSWEGQDGQKRYTTEIVANNIQFLSSGANESTQDYSSNTAGGSQEFQPEPFFDSSEEVPF